MVIYSALDLYNQKFLEMKHVDGDTDFTFMSSIYVFVHRKWK